MKEKKMVVCIILGVALVSIITVIVAGFAESLSVFIDYKLIDYGCVSLGGVLLGIAFVAAFIANKKNRVAVNRGLTIVIVAYCVFSLIGLRFSPKARYSWHIELFVSYMATAITLMVSTVLIFAAWLYLTHTKKKEESAKTEPETDI